HRIVVLARGGGGLAHREFGRCQDAGRLTRILVLFLARRGGGLAALIVGILWPVRRLHFSCGCGRRRQIELGGDHQRGALAVLDAAVFHVGAADAAHDAFDDLFLEGLVVLVLVIGRAQRSGGHHEANAEGNGGKPQGPAQRAGLQHPEAGYGLAHRAVPIHHFRNTRGPALRGVIAPYRRVRIGRDQGAFAAGTPRNESYNRPATPATMATSARLKTYQLKVFPPISMWNRAKSTTAPCRKRSTPLPTAPPMIRPSATVANTVLDRAIQIPSTITAIALIAISATWASWL